MLELQAAGGGAGGRALVGHRRRQQTSTTHGKKQPEKDKAGQDSAPLRQELKHSCKSCGRTGTRGDSRYLGYLCEAAIMLARTIIGAALVALVAHELRPCSSLGSVMRISRHLARSSSIGSRAPRSLSDIHGFHQSRRGYLAWRGSKRAPQRTAMLSSASETSSYDVDTDEEAEQSLAQSPVIGDAKSSIYLNGNTIDASTPEGRANLLSELSLDLSTTIASLPEHRTVSSTDVFCNRELRLDNIRAVGFDMDYTLAQYQQPAFDQLAFDGAKEKLVTLGYPDEVLDFVYDHTFWIRGLIIDTQRGNFLKIDRHKYVRVAYHGFNAISSAMRKEIYSRTFNKQPSFTEKTFVNMDTLFQFVDAHLFALLIEMKDNGDSEFLDFKTYDEIYRDIRRCVDLCHRDGVIKDEVARDPSKYLVLDDGMMKMLTGFRESGTKCFLLTNSYWEYTQTAMNYLYHGKKVDDETLRRNEWLELFDLVVVGSCKPAYLTDPYLNLFRVDPGDGSLRNTDGLFEIEALGENGAAKFLSMGKTFQGGNWNHLQAMLDIQAGGEM